MSIVWNIGAFLVAIAVLVAVHEFGHFWVARRCGVKVFRFSLGFGPILLSREDKQGTVYTLSAIPLGGFVKMLDGREDTLTDDNRCYAFDQQPLLKRAAIVFAGPFANFIFALFAYWLVFVIGFPIVKPVVGAVAPNSIAAQAGMMPQMEFKKINGVPVYDWMDVSMYLGSAMTEPSLTIDVADINDQTQVNHLTLNLQNWHFDPNKDFAPETLGITPYQPKIYTELSIIVEHSPAEKAGLKVGDIIKKINEDKINSWDDIVNEIQKSPGKSLVIQVERHNKLQLLSLIPASVKGKDGVIRGHAGFSPKVDSNYIAERRFNPITAIGKAYTKTKEIVVLIMQTLGKLFTGNLALKDLGGPIAIAQGAGATAQYSITAFLGFLALISINLGIMNLLPLPVLDGGHLMFFAIEGVTKRPISKQIEAWSYKIGSLILFVVMIVVVTHDIMRL